MNRHPTAAGRHIITAAVVGIALPAPTALAQDPPPPETDTVTVLSPLLVTPRKREEHVHEVPLALSAFSGRDLELRQVVSTDQLGQVTPNLIFNNSGAFAGTKSAAQIYIRGVGQRDYLPVTDPGVAVYVDGIYMPRSLGAVIDLLDLERVEVLRGPQGTLFGRNAVGGAVSLHSRRPDAESRGSVRAEFGNDRMTNLTASASGALSDALFGSATFALRKRDGYVTRVHDGVDLGDDNGVAARGTLVWQPSEAVYVFATADVAIRRENGAPAVHGGVNDKAAFATFGNGLLPECTAISINPNFPESGPPSFPPPGTGAGGAEGCYGPDSFAGEYVSEGTFPVFADLDSYGGSVDVSWSLGENTALRSLTGYRGLLLEASRDADNTPANILQNGNRVESAQISQELQLSGDGLEQRLHWQTGLFAVREDGFSRTALTLPTGAYDSNWDYRNTSLAGFAQLTGDVTDIVALTVGARYTKDRKSVTPNVLVLGDASAGRGSIHGPTWPLAAGTYRAATGPLQAGDLMLANREFSQGFEAFNAMANVAVRWSDDLMTYAGVADGFKSGGFDARIPARPPGHEDDPTDAAPTSYNPETVVSYEVGLKSRLNNGRLNLNLALFRADYEDMQLIVRESINPITINGGSADISGVELEATWVPGTGWDVLATIGALSASYDSLSDVALENNTPLHPDYRLTKAPAYSHALGIGKAIPAWGRLVTPRIHWTFTGSQYHDPVNTPQLFQDGYHLLNASITLATEDGRWEAVSAFRNLTDERYLVTGTSAFGTAAAYVEQIYGRPFEWSFSITHRW